MDELKTPTTSKGNEASLSASSDASSQSGVYRLSYGGVLYKAFNGCLKKCTSPFLILPWLGRERVQLSKLL